MHYYQSCLEAILQNSPDAKVFCLVHKMDLVQDDQRDLVSIHAFRLLLPCSFNVMYLPCIGNYLKFATLPPTNRHTFLIFSHFINSLQIFKEREEDLKRLSKPLDCTCFATSIWDETLYKVSLQVLFIPAFHRLKFYLIWFTKILSSIIKSTKFIEEATFSFCCFIL